MKMSMNDLPKQRREEIVTLEVLWRNFRQQRSSQEGASEIILEIPLGDADSGDKESIAPDTFCRVARSFQDDGIRVDQYDKDDVLPEAHQSDYPDQVGFCKVTVPSNFEIVYKRLLLDATGGALEASSGSRLIHRSEDGHYVYNGKPIQMGADTIYYKIFGALHSQSDQNGFLSYEAIERQLIKKGEGAIDGEEERNKRINNAINNQLFRFAKVNGQPLQNATLRGEKLIEVVRGQGLKFNNPKI